MRYSDNVIFVFGSNLAGIHGAGAAAFANKELGARWGVGEGITGFTYALPTKDHNIVTLNDEDIKYHILKFFDTCEDNPDKIFVLTPVGCGLAGLDRNHVLNLIKSVRSSHILPENVVLSTSWVMENYNGKKTVHKFEDVY